MRGLFVALLVANLICAVVFVLGYSAPVGTHTETLAARFPAELQLLPHSASAVDSPIPPAPTALCSMIGPIADEQLTQRISNALSAAGYQASFKTLEGRQVLYWVYLPSLDSPEAAARRLKELHALGVDGFIVNSGADKNSISLGLYTIRQSAAGVQARLAAMGHEVLIREKVRENEERWLVLRGDSRDYVEKVMPELSGYRASGKPCD